MLKELFCNSYIPGVIGLKVCANIPVISPGGDNAELFRNGMKLFCNQLIGSLHPWTLS